MKRIVVALVSILAVLVSLLANGPNAGAASAPRDRLDVYTGRVTMSEVAQIVDLGIDRHELRISAAGARGAKATVRVEAILSGRQVRALERDGIDLTAKKIDGQTVAQRATAAAASGFEVFRRYSGPGGLQEEFQQTAAANPRITKLVSIGQSVNGKDIVALKVTKNARQVRDGKKPAVLYLGAQHAREWITPEMIRRLMHYFVDGYAGDKAIRKILDRNELWFVPVANPDGYDFTFEPDQRLWRKNLRDNNGDGQITTGDGVDPNRNFATKWGYDNEGSSPDPTSETYRGPSPGSEPETQALDSFADRVGFEFFVNYHSAAELLLYGTGWQVATPTPDDVIYEAMAGDDAHPAVPGYDPDISAELYTTNGDTDTHLTELYGTLGFTPEMSTCEAASASDPDDEWEVLDCGSGFEFPDDEALVQAEFEKNIPFALSVAKSAADPDDPVSSVGRSAEDFRVDTFEVSYGDPQTVAVVAKRALKKVRLHYRIGNGRTRTARVSEWAGGERYGDENDDYYAELRGVVRGARPGQNVTVWFSARKATSERFTYRLASDTGDDVLVIANEDYTGVNPTYPAGTTSPKYDDVHVAAVEAAGYDTDVWDVDRQGVPHDLGVLSHYDALLWYQGDDRLPQDPEDELTSTPLGNLPDISVKETQQYLTMAVRDYLNAGGKLVHASETAQFTGLPGISNAVGGLYYGLNGDPSAECVISPRPNGGLDGFFEDCLILADDFRQYWLGGYIHNPADQPVSFLGIADPIAGASGDLGAPATTRWTRPGVRPDQRRAAGGRVPAVRQPGRRRVRGVRDTEPVPAGGGRLVRRRAARRLDVHPADPHRRPHRGRRRAGAELAFQLSADTEGGYDHVIVEAHPVGSADWRTLPETGGLTTADLPAECAGNPFLLDLHPFLLNYLGGPNCSSPDGDWHSVTGSSGGWQDASFDLSSYAGQQVEVSIAYVTDPFTGGVGAFVDDTRIVIGGTVTEAEGFETGLGPWAVTGPPAGSPPSPAAWERSAGLIDLFAGTSTKDTLLLGFGLEHVATAAQRNALIKQALDNLIP